MDKLLLPVLLGTNRKYRNSLHPARWLFGEMEKRPEIQTRLFDTADFALPHDDYGQALKDLFPEWRDTIIKADGLVIVSPEYNHGYPGILKAVLDLLLKEYIHKAVAFVGVSFGRGAAHGLSKPWCRWSASWAWLLPLLTSTSRRCNKRSTLKEDFWIQLSRNGQRIFWTNLSG